MIYGADYNIEFDCWKSRYSGKVDDVRGKGNRRRERVAHRPPSNYLPRQIWDIRLRRPEISLTPGDSPPFLTYSFWFAGLLSLPAPDTGYEDTLFFRMTRSPKD